MLGELRFGLFAGSSECRQVCALGNDLEDL